jgi:hypothetical protein
MSEDRRIYEILETIQKIKDSELSVTDYFKLYEVPFSRAQYYNYCNVIKKYGEKGLIDKRIDGNNTKLSQSIKEYIVTLIEEYQNISSTQLHTKIFNKFNIIISRLSEKSLTSLYSI